MDSFGVPKKINRHVLKALYTLQANGVDMTEFSTIQEYVKSSMKNLVPVKNLNSALRESLQNMAELGVIAKNGCKYSLPHVESMPSSSKQIDPKVFKMKVNRQGDGSNVKPNAKRKRLAGVVQLPGVETEKAHKRARINKALRQRGNNGTLPKNRLSYGLHALGGDLEQGSRSDSYGNLTEDDEDGHSQRTEPKLSFNELEFDCSNEMDPNNPESAREENWQEQEEQYPEEQYPERQHPERQYPEELQKKSSSEDVKNPSPKTEPHSGEVITAIEPLDNGGSDEARNTDGGGDGSMMFGQRNVLKRC